MVGTEFINKIVRQLEKYLIRKNNFRLTGQTYDLIMFMPSKDASTPKYSLIVSAKSFDNSHILETTESIFTYLLETISFDEYVQISRINILNSEDAFVRNINFVFAMRNKIYEITNYYIGTVTIEHAFFVKSVVLDKLIEGNATTIKLNDERTMNAGIMRIERNYDLVFYTRKGLDEIFPRELDEEKINRSKELKALPEETLIEQNYVSRIPFDSIAGVL